MVMIEVKDWSRTGHSQLSDYYQALEQEKYNDPTLNCSLVLLCRWASANKDEEKYLTGGQAYWYEVYDATREAIPRVPTRYATEQYLLNAFLDFLEGEGMALNKVKSKSDLHSLLKMISVAAYDVGIPNQDEINWWASSVDVGISFNGQQFVVVVEWQNPKTIMLEANKKWKDARRKKVRFIWSRFTSSTQDDVWVTIEEELPENFYRKNRHEQLIEIQRILRSLYTVVHSPARRNAG